MQMSPYLIFDGQCEAAFKFYEKCLGGKIVTLSTFGGSPMAGQVPADWHPKILHASLGFDDGVLMGSDAPPGRYAKPQGISIALGLADPARADAIFTALAENGTVTMPLQKTFWAVLFGMFVDRFGISWMINCGTAE